MNVLLLWLVAASTSFSCTPRDTEPPIAISQYYARFGNNLFQIINAFYAGLSLGLPVQVPPHRNRILRLIANRTHAMPCVDGVKLPAVDQRKQLYFYAQSCTSLGLAAPPAAAKRRVASGTLAPLLRFDADLRHLQLDRALVVHVRSGDIFSKYPHSGYWQPPLWWYLNISTHHRLHNGQDAPLVVVTEPDFINPVVRNLQARGWLIVSSTVEADFQALAQARFFGLSHGTFSLTAALCSTQLHTLYAAVLHAAPSNINWVNDTRVIIINIHLPGYAIGPWKNTPEQRQQMIEYSPSV